MGTVASAVGKTLKQIFARNEDIRIVMVGLDAAGKTTIMYTLKLGEVVTTIPTIGFNVETIQYKNVNITAWDVGGKDKIRPLWRFYYEKCNALVFVVDCHDRDRMKNPFWGNGGAEENLKELLSEHELKGVPLLVFANKRDLLNAQTAEEVWDGLLLSDVRDRPVRLQGCVATTGAGLYDGLEWLSQTVRDMRAGKNTFNGDEKELRRVTQESISQTTSLPDVLVAAVVAYLVFRNVRECPD